MTNTTFNVVDLFCGAGGMSLGFAEAGFRLVSGFDCWQPAVETYKANLGDHVILAEIDDVSRLPDADVIVGGPPCQGFSSAGARRKGDRRNTSIGDFARLVARSLPRAFVFENVEGFVTNDDGRFVIDLLEPLIEAGYSIHLRKVNAANYGVPQNRKRVIAIGGHGWIPTFPSPTHSAWGTPGAIATLALLPAPSLGDALADLPTALPESRCQSGSDPLDHAYPALNEIDLERAMLLKPGQRMRDLPQELWHESYRRRAFRRVKDGTPTERRGGAPAGVRRLSFDEPCKAITGGSQSEFLHPSEHRPLTIRECARLQTFPDSFSFFGTRSDRMQLIGNAVPPRLAAAIARQLRADLADKSSGANSPGRLVSFRPTHSAGMSPALERVCRTVWNQFGDTSQGLLADAAF